MSFIPISFYATQIVNPFLNSSTYANHVKVKGHSANDKILLRGMKLYCTFFFVLMYILFFNSTYFKNFTLRVKFRNIKYLQDRGNYQRSNQSQVD